MARTLFDGKDHQSNAPDPTPEQIRLWESTRATADLIVDGLVISGYPSAEIQRRYRTMGVTAVISTTHRRPPDLHGIWVIRAPFSDDVATLPDRNLISRTAIQGVDMLLDNHVVAVHCAYGLNRSSLVAAHILKYLTPNMRGKEILELIQSRRSGALHNKLYAEHVRNL